MLRWAKELGAKKVPSLYSLEKCRKAILNKVGDPTKKSVSASGNVFYVNDVGAAIAKVRRSFLRDPLTT